MKALSLLQPWAQLMADGRKKIETRSWASSHRGLLAIAASARMKGPEKECAIEFGYDVQSLPLGAIVCLVNLKGCYPTEFIARSAKFTEEERTYGDYEEGRFGWMTQLVHTFAQPIPCKGVLGLWEVPDEVLAEVLAQLPVDVIEGWNL